MDLDMRTADPRTQHHSLMTCTENIVLLVNLKKTLDDKALTEILGPYGEIQWLQVVKNNQGASYGFAYAKFYLKESADCLISNLPPIPVEKEGQLVQCIKSNLKASSRLCDGGKYQLTGLVAEATETHLKQLIQNSGPYFSCKFFKQKEAKDDYFIVHMLTEWHMARFFENLAKTKLKTANFKAVHYDDVFTSGGGADGKLRIVFRPYNLEPETTSDDLYKTFRLFGNIQARVYKDARGKSRCQGSVFFNKPYPDCPLLHLFDSIEEDNGILILKQKCGHLCGVAPLENRQIGEAIQTMFYPSAQPPINKHYYRIPKDYRRNITAREFIENKEDDSEDAKFILYYHVHVSNIDESVTYELLWELFQEYGEVANSQVLTANEKRYGIVSFENVTEARKACEAFNELREEGKTEWFVALIDSYQLHYWNEEQARVHRLNNAISCDDLRNAEFPMYRDKVHQFSEEGHVKQFSKENYSAVTKFRYNSLAEEVDKGFEELNRLGKQLESRVQKLEDEAQARKAQASASAPQAAPQQAGPSTSAAKPAQAAKTPVAVNGEFVCNRLKTFFSKRTKEDIAALMGALREIPAEELTRLHNDDEALRVFCLKHLINKARAEAKK